MEKLSRLFFRHVTEDKEATFCIGPKNYGENCSIVLKSFRTMKPRTWLEVTAINLSLFLVHKARLPTRDFKFFPTFFIQQLVDGHANQLTQLVDNKLKIAYSTVKNYSRNRWGKQRVFGCMKPRVVPICKGANHWVMLVVYVQERKIRYFDSFKSPDPLFCDLVHMYLEEKWKALFLIDDHDNGPWILVKKSPKGDTPQKNGWDCGILMCGKVEHLFAKRKLPRGAEQCFERRMEYAL